MSFPNLLGNCNLVATFGPICSMEIVDVIGGKGNIVLLMVVAL